MAWIDTNWQQDDSINSGYPYPVGVSAPAGFIYDNIYEVWHFTEGVNNNYPYVEQVVSFNPEGIYTSWEMGNPTLSYYPYTHLPTMLGAFNYCLSLETASIPETVKFIGDYAFWNTSLTEVTIAIDCCYYAHSFPVGCNIRYYGEIITNFITADGIVLQTADGMIFEAKE